MTRISIKEYTEAVRWRYLRSSKVVKGRRPFSTTKPGSLLKSAIPIRTFADWEENHSGFAEADLVPHLWKLAVLLAIVYAMPGWALARKTQESWWH